MIPTFTTTPKQSHVVEDPFPGFVTQHVICSTQHLPIQTFVRMASRSRTALRLGLSLLGLSRCGLGFECLRFEIGRRIARVRRGGNTRKKEKDGEMKID